MKGEDFEKNQITRLLNQKPGIMYQARRDSDGFIHVYKAGQTWKILNEKEFNNFYKEV